jgi:hypothetical protein
MSDYNFSVLMDFCKKYDNSLNKKSLSIDVLRTIRNRIREEDNRISKTIHTHKEIQTYVNVEAYCFLIASMERIDDEEIDKHHPGDCPVCHKIRLVRYLVDCLEAIWKMEGTHAIYRDAIIFRGDLSEEKVIN